MTKGIKKKWLFNNIGLLVSIVVILIVMFFIAIKGYFYSEIRKKLDTKSSAAVSTFNDKENFLEEEFLTQGLSYVKDFNDRDSINLMLINAEDEIVALSPLNILQTLNI